ncbi:hypothetical protein EGM88_10335 [Aureibaculum marinum]|uniref:Bacteriophage abortive infection AbiH n=1 Tax=Aureibaculum marinum TaxID=2487930 RepID=A0A3N4NQI2_9FLAO|nr:AbiH family protein [Aureibaculum marinum]RPD96748.1 hypothetical protein EGM88_10335 [Aureibaculum marinum]
MIEKFVFIDPKYDLFDPIKQTENYNDFIQYVTEYAKAYGYTFDPNSKELFTSPGRRSPIFKFKNDFFKLINNKNSITNWVDIENEYYNELKTIIRSNNIDVSIEKVKQLNKEFGLIKELFENYLLEEVCQKIDFENFENPKNYFEIYDVLVPNLSHPYLNLNGLSEKNFLNEFSFKEDKEEIKSYIKSNSSETHKFYKSYLLSFNYTPTIHAHKFLLDKKQNYDFYINYIHGKIGDPDNPINFGFGDETDKDYKMIEDLNDGEFLKNFKSFQYSNTTNYNDLFSYIEEDKYQVYILGHSCGLSDRVLLNAIFEHKNCRSIKVYYHEKGDDDNYTEIVQNISRHFNDKKVMRRKIVSKPYCKALPQNLRFKALEDLKNETS